MKKESTNLKERKERRYDIYIKKSDLIIKKIQI